MVAHVQANWGLKKELALGLCPQGNKAPLFTPTLLPCHSPSSGYVGYASAMQRDLFPDSASYLSASPLLPSGGYVGYASTTQWGGPGGQPTQVIGFDMGGTSTDVSRYAGEYEHVFESTTAGVTIQVGVERVQSALFF